MKIFQRQSSDFKSTSPNEHTLGLTFGTLPIASTVMDSNPAPIPEHPIFELLN